MSADPSGVDESTWRSRAACSNLATEMFFPIGEAGAAIEQTRYAKAVCETCPVQTDCLEFALDTNQPAGIFGGLTEDERRSLRRRRARARRLATG